MRMIHSLHWCFLTELINSRIESGWTHGKRHPGVISPPRSINLLFIDFPMFSFLRSAVSSGWEKKNKDPPHQMLLEKPLSLRVLQTVLFCHNSLYISSTHRQTVIYLKHNFINIFEGCKVKSACNSQPILCLLCAVFQSETTLLNHFSKLQLLEYIYKQIYFTFISVCAVSL